MLDSTQLVYIINALDAHAVVIIVFYNINCFLLNELAPATHDAIKPIKKV